MSDIYVYPRANYPAATIRLGQQEWPGVIGKNGGVPEDKKQEGDQSTPLGTFTLGRIYARPHLLGPLPQHIAQIIVPIKRELVWCDDPTSPYYNQPVNRRMLPHGVSAEQMWRDDHLYNIVVGINYNRPFVRPGKGSAIFMHIARDQERPESAPTNGCIALKQQDLIALLGQTSGRGTITIQALA